MIASSNFILSSPLGSIFKTKSVNIRLNASFICPLYTAITSVPTILSCNDLTFSIASLYSFSNSSFSLIFFKNSSCISLFTFFSNESSVSIALINIGVGVYFVNFECRPPKPLETQSFNSTLHVNLLKDSPILVQIFFTLTIFPLFTSTHLLIQLGSLAFPVPIKSISVSSLFSFSKIPVITILLLLSKL